MSLLVGVTRNRAGGQSTSQAPVSNPAAICQKTYRSAAINDTFIHMQVSEVLGLDGCAIVASDADRVAEVEDFVDFLSERVKRPKTTTGREPLDFPVDDLGPWPEGLSLRREDMYGDDGR